jgi:hypothetical protein
MKPPLPVTMTTALFSGTANSCARTRQRVSAMVVPEINADSSAAFWAKRLKNCTARLYFWAAARLEVRSGLQRRCLKRDTSEASVLHSHDFEPQVQYFSGVDNGPHGDHTG